MQSLEEQYFPSWKQGYRCNPFRTLTRQEWGDLALLAPSFLPVLDQQTPLVQILGEKGYGKTSLLMALTRHFEQQGEPVTYVYIETASQSIPPLSRYAEILLIDEAQRLSKPAMLGLFRSLESETHKSQRLIFTSHVDLTQVADEHNLKIASYNLPAYTFAFIRQIIAARLEYFSIPGETTVQLSPAALEELFHHTHANLRELESVLFELFQTWENGELIDADDLRSFLDKQA
jgi:Cdc6-like AAA superfamily ATPase